MAHKDIHTIALFAFERFTSDLPIELKDKKLAIVIPGDVKVSANALAPLHTTFGCTTISQHTAGDKKKLEEVIMDTKPAVAVYLPEDSAAAQAVYAGTKTTSSITASYVKSAGTGQSTVNGDVDVQSGGASGSEKPKSVGQQDTLGGAQGRERVRDEDDDDDKKYDGRLVGRG